MINTLSIPRICVLLFFSVHVSHAMMKTKCVGQHPGEEIHKKAFDLAASICQSLNEDKSLLIHTGTIEEDPFDALKKISEFAGLQGSNKSIWENGKTDDGKINLKVEISYDPLNKCPAIRSSLREALYIILNRRLIQVILDNK